MRHLHARPSDIHKGREENGICDMQVSKRLTDIAFLKNEEKRNRSENGAEDIPRFAFTDYSVGLIGQQAHRGGGDGIDYLPTEKHDAGIEAWTGEAYWIDFFQVER